MSKGNEQAKTEKIYRPYKQTLAAAQALVVELEPYCERIEIAGSLRRHKPQVGDIEIAGIAKPQLNLFGEPMDSTEIDGWIFNSGIVPSLNGKKQKQFNWTHEGEVFQVDLFLAQPENFGYIYMIRTGSAEFCKRMFTPQAEGGLRPAGLSGKDGQVWSMGAALAVPEEADIFELWGMDAPAPEARE